MGNNSEVGWGLACIFPINMESVTQLSGLDLDAKNMGSGEHFSVRLSFFITVKNKINFMSDLFGENWSMVCVQLLKFPLQPLLGHARYVLEHLQICTD